MNSETDPHLPRRFVAAIVLGAALIPLNSTMIAVALPAIGDSFQVNPGDLTLWLVTSYLLVNIILLSPAGKLGDLLGRRRAFGIGLSLFALGVVTATFAPSLAVVAASRVLMAAGGAMLMPNAMALLRVVIAEPKRARVFGYFGAMLGASAAIGPLVGGILTQYFGWEAIFLVNLPILVLSWGLVQSDTSYDRVKPERRDKHPRFDFIGMGLLAFSLAVMVIGMKTGGFWTLLALVCSGLGFYVFIRWEQRAAEPLIDLGLFRRVPFVIGGTVVGLQNLGMYALLFQLPFLLQTWYRIDAGTMGQVLLVLTIFMVFLAPVGGRLSERLGTRPTVLGGLLVSLFGMVMLLATTGSTSLVWMVISLAWVGGGIGIVSGPVQSAALSAIDAEQGGVASGILSTMRYLGGIAGITIISIFLTDETPAGLLEQNLICFSIYTGVYLLAFLIVLAFPGPTKNATTTA